jgi:hypothetical protein
VAYFLRTHRIPDHNLWLAYQEQVAIRVGDLDALRDIRAYRNRVDRKT